ncbi:DUF3293 domain-containing protein [Deinococcus puniceus]|uniref:DUF3293 domain-containing protein n=1 Tax=Deinococcus puniceus TaxID=1182568 RepID=UPI0007C89313|nr:DUF3293 domain-containing protein [Deinococcus puniceus]
MSEKFRPIKFLAPEPDQALRAAFLGTTYGPVWHRFHLGTELQRRPEDEPSEELGPEWAIGLRSWVIVTAWNPRGQPQSQVDNADAHQRLLARVSRAGLVPTLALNGDGQWRETALILPGASLRDGIRLGREFAQAAVLYGVGRRVALVWLTVDRRKVDRGGVDRRSGERCRVERYWVQDVKQV